VGQAAERVRALEPVKTLPPGVREVPSGDAEFLAEMVSGFAIAFGSGILLMYAVLVLLFKSFTYPITIMAALPLAIGGAFIGLLLMGSSFSISSLIGGLMLMGVAATNSILLVDYVIMAQKAGMTRYEPLLDPAHKRARPLTMTPVPTRPGTLPIAIGLGADVAFRQPMAIAVIGGLIPSTFLSLLFIPAIFTIVDDGAGFFRRRLDRMFEGQRHTPGRPQTTPAE